MEKRIYDKSTINPKGTPENPLLCIDEVMDGTGWHLYQCSRKRGHGIDGLYCKQHARKHERNLTKHAPDVVESAASVSTSPASEVSASEAESTPATTQVM